MTDSNRKRAHHWRSSQEVWGATEGVTAVVDSFDAFDNRLPVFPLNADHLETQSISENYSGITMSATSYGALLSYLPEYRPANANDGNLETSWAVGWGVNPVGQVLTFTSNIGGPEVDHLELIPAQVSGDQRHVSSVAISVDGSSWTHQVIDPNAPMTNIELEHSGHTVRLRIDSVTLGDDQLPVGWAEILPTKFQQAEFITVPRDATLLATPETPVSYAFTRLRADEYKTHRQDPEMSINRIFYVSHEDHFTLTAEATSTSQFAIDDQCRDDLVLLDDQKISVRIVESQDKTLLLEGCENLFLNAGERILQTTLSSPIHIDRIVLRSALAENPYPSQVLPISQSRTDRTTSITSCTSGCWIELKDGWNIGWEGSLSGQTLGDPIASSGGRLTWRLPATPEGTVFETTWTPQSRMWLGIAITLLGLIACLFTLAIVRLRRRTLRSDVVLHQSTRMVNTRLGATIAAAALAGLVISPLYGLLAGAIVALAYTCHRLHIVGIALITLGMLFLMAQQIRTGATPSFGWPSVFRRSHQPVYLGVVFLALASWLRPPPMSDDRADSTASV